MKPRPHLVFLTAVSMCGGPAVSSGPSTDGFTCADYALMLQVELELGRACTADDDCAQVVFPEPGACPSSVLLNGAFDSEYLLQLHEEALAAGCTVELPVADDCAADDAVCADGACAWR